jgi:hypothetical protein
MLLALGFASASRWLWRVPLRFYFLKLDDFIYLSRCRTFSALAGNLFTPHNGHVVPLFLLETHLLARLAGSLEALPAAMSWASYATLVLAMALTGHLVAWESGRLAWGLAAMAAVGLSSVLGPAVAWYAASQALVCGTVILFMLAGLQAWRSRGSWWLLAAGSTAALAAPLFWSAGYSAGLVGLAYLWADGRRRCRYAAVLPPAASLATGLLVWFVAARTAVSPADLTQGSRPYLVRLGPALTHTAQAVTEALILNNLGLDATTTGWQAIVVMAFVLAAWTWSRRGFSSAVPGSRALHNEIEPTSEPPRTRSSQGGENEGAPSPPLAKGGQGGVDSHRPSAARDPIVIRSKLRANPLESAGAVLVLASFGMIFAVRGTDTSFDNLRALGWYDAIPQLGAVLFVAGWCSRQAESPLPRSIGPPSLRELLAVALLAAVVLSLQVPRAQRVIFQYDGLAAPIAPEDRPVGARMRTLAELTGQAGSQRRALAELDHLERTVSPGGQSRRALGEALQRIAMPGMPDSLPGFDPVELLKTSPKPATLE